MFWLTGCDYNHKLFPVTANPDGDDFVIQINDYGQFWDRSAPERALEKVSELLKTSNVIVVLFVHGWHHDAEPDDENLRDFSVSMADTRGLLIDSSNPQSAVYRLSRKNLTGSESLSVVSIYVGWRGRSLPGIFDYATFWGRKAAAERVGEGDLRAFLGRLNALYRERRNLRATGATRNFFGLASFGHSFGGQVLFRSVAYEIENELLTRAANTTGSRNTSEQVTDLLGFGDLVVLVNPAFEALQFERIWRLSTALEFGRQQSPIMLVVSSAGDVPRQVLFPISRNLNAFFLRLDFGPGQRALWTQALGEYEPFRTHSIDVVPKSLSDSTPSFDPLVYKEDPCAIADLNLTNLPSNSGTSPPPPKVPGISRPPTELPGIRLTPTGHHPDNNPFLIAHASIRVVLNHSEVFEPTLRLFLNDYIAIAQGKRIVTADSSLACK